MQASRISMPANNNWRVGPRLTWFAFMILVEYVYQNGLVRPRLWCRHIGLFSDPGWMLTRASTVVCSTVWPGRLDLHARFAATPAVLMWTLEATQAYNRNVTGMNLVYTHLRTRGQVRNTLGTRATGTYRKMKLCRPQAFYTRSSHEFSSQQLIPVIPTFMMQLTHTPNSLNTKEANQISEWNAF